MKKVTITSGELNSVLIEDNISNNNYELRDLSADTLSSILPELVQSDYDNGLIESLWETISVYKNDDIVGELEVIEEVVVSQEEIDLIKFEKDLFPELV